MKNKGYISIALALLIVGAIAYSNFGIPLDTKGFSSTKLYKWKSPIAKLDRQEQLDMIKQNVELFTPEDVKDFNSNILPLKDDNKNRLFFFKIKLGEYEYVLSLPKLVRYDKEVNFSIDKDKKVEGKLVELFKFQADKVPNVSENALVVDDLKGDDLTNLKAFIKSRFKFKDKNKVYFPFNGDIDYVWKTNSKDIGKSKVPVTWSDNATDSLKDKWDDVYIGPDKDKYNIDFKLGKFYCSFTNMMNWWCYSKNPSGLSTQTNYVPMSGQKLTHGDLLGLASKSTKFYIYYYDDKEGAFKVIENLFTDGTGDTSG